MGSRLRSSRHRSGHKRKLPKGFRIRKLRDMAMARLARDVVDSGFDSSDDEIPLAVLWQGKRAEFKWAVTDVSIQSTSEDVSIQSTSEAKAEDSSIANDDGSWNIQGNW